MVADRIANTSRNHVWTPVDFLDLGGRDAVDKVLQRLVHKGRLRRLDRGLYDTPRTSARDRVLGRLSVLLADPVHGKELRDDLRSGLATLPAWMQDIVRELLRTKTRRVS